MKKKKVEEVGYGSWSGVRYVRTRNEDGSVLDKYDDGDEVRSWPDGRPGDHKCPKCPKCGGK